MKNHLLVYGVNLSDLAKKLPELRGCALAMDEEFGFISDNPSNKTGELVFGIPVDLNPTAEQKEKYQKMVQVLEFELNQLSASAFFNVGFNILLTELQLTPPSVFSIEIDV